MAEVLVSLWTLLVLIAAGFVLAKTGFAPPGSDTAITKVCFALPMPAMIFQAVHRADITEVFSLGLLANVLSALILFTISYFLACRVFRLTRGAQTIAALCASYTNAGNIGVPYLIAITGDPTLAAAIMLFQLGFLMPLAFFLLGLQTDPSRDPQTRTRRKPSAATGTDTTPKTPASPVDSSKTPKKEFRLKRQILAVSSRLHAVTAALFGLRPCAAAQPAPHEPTPKPLATRLGESLMAGLIPVLRQPPLYGLAAGVLWSAFSLPVPPVLGAPLEMLAKAVVPMLMIAVGINTSRAHLQELREGWRLLATVVGFRIVLSPLLTFALAVAFGVSGPMLLAAMVVATFPVANNVFVFAMKFGVAQELARNAMVISTLLSFPAVTLVALLLR